MSNSAAVQEAARLVKVEHIERRVERPEWKLQEEAVCPVTMIILNSVMQGNPAQAVVISVPIMG
tara:strand:+ start:162 stop:353 length:192 start_codon:yes stop_codon:yes gene_type:complete